ncbi:hypothetical protein D9758_011829 [Tetrapyrgos nigripes]|uniref:Autophagy-related protein 11 n=1 Tax=Tetrapyrgos nigripes TaxID=182062 RepID=A0A8H5FNL8_9AGAR|nr:hypothetical protein D9758_011829 [Tetrapyrgos nigripes]
MLQTEATWQDLERFGNVQVFLQEVAGLGGGSPSALVAYLSDGKRLTNENVRDLAGMQDQIIFVFNKTYLELDYSQLSVEQEQALLAGLGLGVKVDSEVDGDALSTTPPTRPSPSPHHLQTQLSHLALSLHYQHQALSIASSSLSYSLLSLLPTVSQIAEGLRGELGKQEKLLGGLEGDLELIARVRVHRDFYSGGGGAGAEGRVVRDRTLGDYVSVVKMRQVGETCRRTHDELLSRFTEMELAIKRVQEGEVAVRERVGDVGLLDEADICIRRAQEVFDQIQVSQSQGQNQDMGIEQDQEQQTPRQRQSAELNTTGTEESESESESTLQTTFHTLLSLKNTYTLHVLRTLQMISRINEEVVRIPVGMGVLKGSFRGRGGGANVSSGGNLSASGSGSGAGALVEGGGGGAGTGGEGGGGGGGRGGKGHTGAVVPVPKPTGGTPTSFAHIERLHGMLYAYGATVVEVVRRKEFSRFFYQRTQNILDVMAKLSSSERKRRQIYRSEIHGQLPFDTKFLGEEYDPVPGVDVVFTGRGMTRKEEEYGDSGGRGGGGGGGGGGYGYGYGLEREDVEALLNLLSSLEQEQQEQLYQLQLSSPSNDHGYDATSFTPTSPLGVPPTSISTSTSIATSIATFKLSTLHETLVLLEKQIAKMDGLEASWDRVVERGSLTLDDQSSQTSQPNPQQLIDQLHTAQEAKNALETLFNEANRESLLLQNEVERLKKDNIGLEKQLAKFGNLADQHQLLKVDYQLSEARLEKALKDVYDVEEERRVGDEGLRRELEEVRRGNDELKGVGEVNEALKDEVKGLRRELEEARKENDELEGVSEVNEALKDEVKELKEVLREANEEKERLIREHEKEKDELRNELKREQERVRSEQERVAREHERVMRDMRDYRAEADGDRAVLEKEFFETQARLDEMQGMLGENEMRFSETQAMLDEREMRVRELEVQVETGERERGALKNELEKVNQEKEQPQLELESLKTARKDLTDQLVHLNHDLEESRHVERVLREDLSKGRSSQEEYEQRLEEKDRLVAQILDVALGFRESHLKALRTAQTVSAHPHHPRQGLSSASLGDSMRFGMGMGLGLSVIGGSPGSGPGPSQPQLQPDDLMVNLPPIEIDPSDPTAALESLRTFDHDHFQEAISKTGNTVRKWQKQCKEYRERAKGKISFRNFAKGDLALFLPTRNSVSKPWAAFNVSFPHYFLQATGHLAEQLKSREWIVARITSITERIVDRNDPSSNPYGLGDGVKYYMLEVEDWTQPSNNKRRVSSKKQSGIGNDGGPKPSTSPGGGLADSTPMLPPPEAEVEDTFQVATHSPNSHLFSPRTRANSSPSARPSSLSRLLAQASLDTPTPAEVIDEAVPSSPTPPKVEQEQERESSTSTTKEDVAPQQIDNSSPLPSPSLSPSPAPFPTTSPPPPPSPSLPSGSVPRQAPAGPLASHSHTQTPLRDRPGSRGSRLSTTSRFSGGIRPPMGNVSSGSPIKAVATAALSSDRVFSTSPPSGELAITYNNNNPETGAGAVAIPSPEGSISDGISNLLKSSRRRTMSYHHHQPRNSPLALSESSVPSTGSTSTSATASSTATAKPTLSGSTATSTLANFANSWGVSFGRRRKAEATKTASTTNLSPMLETSPVDETATGESSRPADSSASEILRRF